MHIFLVWYTQMYRKIHVTCQIYLTMLKNLTEFFGNIDACIWMLYTLCKICNIVCEFLKSPSSAHWIFPSTFPCAVRVLKSLCLLFWWNVQQGGTWWSLMSRSKRYRCITSDFLLTTLSKMRPTIGAAIVHQRCSFRGVRLLKQPNTVNTAITNAAKSYEMLLLL